MREIHTGIYHRDRKYGKRLMEYLNHQKKYPMTVWYTSDEKKFFEKEKEGCFQCLVLEEETSYGGDLPVFRLESGGCQSGMEIARNIYGCLHIGTAEECRIIGIFSPFGQAFTTEISMEIARQWKLFYFGMQAYHSFSAGEEPMDELLFCIRERKEEALDFFLTKYQNINGIHGYAGASCYLDYHEPSIEDYHVFFNQIKRSGISIIADMETACIPDLSFFQLFDKIYIPLKKEESLSDRYRNFKEQLGRYGTWNSSIFEEIILMKGESSMEVVRRL
ncbi:MULTISPECIES: hypothetical protein [Anaerostipes]|uniref:hypothetical protein n=1 Tax=Anaerostipes TaxID=207244 RepID=UPI0009514E2B|nr:MULTISPECIES: hypothetical protein [Anaerostipes]MCI5622819.1 hypothetical protein [Anaerostipes sp.]MDY2726343.1 hypothetical protein [Anaerostipes faecalis]OLR59466.1 hypothetical protein BHF70_07425 [Anaerostipes sp. 494a]